MNHFIYAMNSEDPAPATGGDTKSWFFHYKWDVDDFTYVPVSEHLLIGEDPDVLWFIMDKVLLGCVHVHAMIPALQGNAELHYHTGLIQVAPEGLYSDLNHNTGRAPVGDTFDKLKAAFDAQYPPRDQELAAGVGLRKKE